MTMRGAKALHLLGRIGGAHVLRSIRRGVRVVLYHHVGPENDLTRHLGCTTPPDLFRAHLDWFRRNYDIVGLEDVSSGRGLPRRPLLITFDDAYRSVLETAAPILRSHDLPSALFVLTDPVFRDRMVLDNLLSFTLERDPGMLASYTGLRGVAAARDVLFNVIPRGGRQLRDEIYDRLDEAHGTEARALARDTDLYLRPEDLPTLEKAGVRLGRHTASHVKLGLVDDVRPELLEEWSACGLSDLDRAFSYPFGAIDDAEATIDAVSSLELAPLFLVEGCANAPGARILFRSSPATSPVGALGTELEIASVVRRLLRRRRIASLERRI